MRTIRNELPKLNMSVLDIEGPDCVTARDLADAVLRQYWINHWESKGTLGDMRYMPQPEVRLRGGVAYVPLIRSSAQPNDRYNARHRKIHTGADPRIRAVELAYKRRKGYYVLLGVPQAWSLLNTDLMMSIEVEYTTLFAIRLKHVGSYSLNVGTCQGGATVVALSDTCRSKLEVPEKLIFETRTKGQSLPCYLRNICALLIAERVISSSRPTGVIVAILGDTFLMSVVQGRATTYGRKVHFLTSQATS